MASVLKVNTLTGVTTAGSIAVTGEGNSTTTNLQQGLAKCWVNFTGITTTAARDSFNVSSLTDNGTGHTTVNINNDMANANYSGYYYTNASTGTGASNFGNHYTGGFSSFATGSCQAYSYSSDDIDAYQNLLGIFGDLA